MTEVEKKALQQADEFLARLSAEAAAKQLSRSDKPEPAAAQQVAQQAPKRQKKKKSLGLGQVDEPGKPKAKAKATPAAESAEVEVGTTNKPVAGQPQYATAIQSLFQGRENPWINRSRRRTALDMWNEDDAERAAEASGDTEMTDVGVEEAFAEAEAQGGDAMEE